jgi:tetratricopeptide (TPR) repeat protein
MKMKLMPEQVKKSLVLFIYFALLISTLLVFWQVRNFDFVNYDDDTYVSDNPHILNGLTENTIIWAFTTGYANFWHPLTWLSYMLDWQLFGLNPAGFHLTNLLFHIANTLLLFFVLKQMTNAVWQSAFVAALFALHPLHVESVAWVSERKDVLSTFFWLLTMWAYVLYAQKMNTAPLLSRLCNRYYLLAVAFFALGLMAKPMLITLPFVFLLLDYWPLERIKHFDRQVIYHLVLEKIPFIVLSIISSVIAFIAQQRGGAVMPFNKISLNFRICNALISYVKYIEKMFWPARLTIFYQHPGQNVSILYAIVSAGFLLAVTILILRYAKNHRYLFTGWFWYLGTLVPVIGIIQVGGFAIADRYTYITLTGLFIIIAWGLSELLKKLPQRKIALGLSMVIVLTTIGICAGAQTSCWKNSFTLFSHALAVTQNNYVAYNNLGLAYNNLGRYNEAIDSYKQAIKIKPDYTEAYNNLGVVYGNLGRGIDSIDAYKQAIKFKPDYAMAYYNLGLACGNLHRWSEAMDALKQAVKIKPDLAEGYYNLGFVYLVTGDKKSAMAEYNILKSLNLQFANDLLKQINK